MEAAYTGMADQTYAWFEEMRSGVANRDDAGRRYTYEVKVMAVGRVVVVDFLGPAQPVLQAISPTNAATAKANIAYIEERNELFGNQGKSKGIDPERTPFLPYGYYAETTEGGALLSRLAQVLEPNKTPSHLPTFEKMLVGNGSGTNAKAMQVNATQAKLMRPFLRQAIVSAIQGRLRAHRATFTEQYIGPPTALEQLIAEPTRDAMALLIRAATERPRLARDMPVPRQFARCSWCFTDTSTAARYFQQTSEPECTDHYRVACGLCSYGSSELRFWQEDKDRLLASTFANQRRRSGLPEDLQQGPGQRSLLLGRQPAQEDRLRSCWLSRLR